MNISNYGNTFRINRQGYIELRTPSGRWDTLGETRTRVFLASLVLSSVVQAETSDPVKQNEMVRVIDKLSTLTTGDLGGDTMRRVFDALHILKIEVGDDDVSPFEIAERLLNAA